MLQITDCHLFADPRRQLKGVNTDESFLSVLQAIRATDKEPNLVLLTGDLAELGEADAYRRLLIYCQQFSCAVYAIPGNHDAVALMKQLFENSKISMTSSFVLGGWHFVLLNSVLSNHSEGRLSHSELNFLQTVLAHHATLPTLIALHHHVKPVHGYMDTMMLTNVDAFAEIITLHKNVRLVLCGHVHQEFAQTVNQVLYLASPSTCFQIRAGMEKFANDGTLKPGYRWLALHDDGTIETEVIRV